MFRIFLGVNELENKFTSREISSKNSQIYFISRAKRRREVEKKKKMTFNSAACVSSLEDYIGGMGEETDEICTFHAFFFSSLLSPFFFFNLTLFPALNRGVYTLRYNRICTGGYLLSMGVSITSTGHKLRHPYRVNTFEFISVVPHLRICFFTDTYINIYSACRFNVFVPIKESKPKRAKVGG